MTRTSGLIAGMEVQMTTTAEQTATAAPRTRRSGPRPYIVLRRTAVEHQGEDEKGQPRVFWEQITVSGPVVASTPKDAIRQAVADRPEHDHHGMFAVVREDEFRTAERKTRTEVVEDWS